MTHVGIRHLELVTARNDVDERHGIETTAARLDAVKVIEPSKGNLKRVRKGNRFFVLRHGNYRECTPSIEVDEISCARQEAEPGVGVELGKSCHDLFEIDRG